MVGWGISCKVNKKLGLSKGWEIGTDGKDERMVDINPDQVGREGAVSTTTSWVDRVGEGGISPTIGIACR